MKIYAPVKDANGTWASVRFINGVGETNDLHLIEWFKSHGYKVEGELQNEYVVDVPEDILNEIESEDEMMGYNEKTPDFDRMTPNDIREWLKKNGYGSKIKNIRSKEKLLEIIRG